MDKGYKQLSTQDSSLTEVRQRIDEFLAQKRIAFVGVSRNLATFSRWLYHDMRKRGYDMVPINLHANAIEGVRAYRRVQDIPRPVGGAFIMLKKRFILDAVKDAEAAGVKRLWIHGNFGPSSVPEEIINYCEQNNLSIIAGYCPYMFLPDVFFIHRLHIWWMKQRNQYPEQA